MSKPTMRSFNKTITWVIVFSIAMAFLESAVVIYLREIYYKEGFYFPLKPIDNDIAKVEFLREIATIIMLVGIGVLVGKNKLQRFAYFCLSFAIWDLFYYVFLYVFLAWPESLSTWDILFLVPVPWVGPVWAPCLISLVMLLGSLFISYQVEKDQNYRISLTHWFLSIAGALICILSFMWDYLSTTVNKNSWSFFTEQNMFSEISTYVPTHFNVTLFLTGFLLMMGPLVYLFLGPRFKKN